jgi:hypothetical protein
MYDQLEAELVQALKAQAGSIPAGAAEKLRAVDYHPRATRTGWRAAGAVAGATATTGAVVSALVLGGSQAAFAGWAPAPNAAAPQGTTSAPACQTQLANSPLAATATGTGWTVLDTDVRGPFTTVLYEDGDVDATCFAGPSFTVVSASSPTGGSTSVSGSAGGPGSTGAPVRGGSTSYSIGTSASGAIDHLSVAHLSIASEGPYTLVEGEVASGVSAVTLVRSYGQDVQASLAGDLFVAWWPGSLDATSAQLTTSSGTTTQPISTTALPAPGLPTPGSGCPAATTTGSVSAVCSGGGRSGPGTTSSGGTGSPGLTGGVTSTSSFG